MQETGQIENPQQRTKRPKVLLTDTSRWAIGARLAICLSKAGCDVWALCPRRGHPFQYTHAIRKMFPYRGLQPLDSLRDAIDAIHPDVVIPCDERGLRHLHELFEWACSAAAGAELAALIRRSLGSPDSYPIVASRHKLLRIACEEGILVPDTKPVNSIDDLRAWRGEQVFPWVLKADGTFGGLGVAICANWEQAKQSLQVMRTPHPTTRVFKRMLVNRDPFWLLPWWKRSRPSVIGQAYIEGRPGNCAAVCWQGKVLGCISVEVVSSLGSTGPATIVRIIDNSDMAVAAKRIAGRLGLSGFFGLDFVIEDGSGRPYLIEMNPRCTPLCHLQLGEGRDLVESLSAQLSGQPFKRVPAVTPKDMIAYFPQAWHDTHSELLELSFQDIPREEPDLVQALLQPWPDRTLLFRLGHALTTLRT